MTCPPTWADPVREHVIRHAHRTTGFFKVRGINVGHPEFEDFMFANAAVNDFKCEAISQDGLDELRVSIEIAAGTDPDQTIASLTDALKSTFELTPVIVVLERGTLVIAAGGGGIPVVRRPDGTLTERAAVIDKDATSCLLARELGASVFIISTDVDKVALHFGTSQQVDIDRMTAVECRNYLKEGHFAAGSMRPKIESALTFLEHGGNEVIITQPHHLSGALQGIYGTHIVP